MAIDIHEIIPMALRNIMNIQELFKDEKKGCIKITLEPNPDTLTIHGEIHGGYISMLTMVAAELVATSILSEEEALVVANHNISFLKHVEAFDEIEVESCIVSRGERIIHIETRIKCKEEEVSRSITSFIAEKM